MSKDEGNRLLRILRRGSGPVVTSRVEIMTMIFTSNQSAATARARRTRAKAERNGHRVTATSQAS